MQIKSIPRRFSGQQVVAFSTSVPRDGESKYMGVALVESAPGRYAVYWLGADSLDSGSWYEVNKVGGDFDWEIGHSVYFVEAASAVQ